MSSSFKYRVSILIKSTISGSHRLIQIYEENIFSSHDIIDVLSIFLFTNNVISVFRDFSIRVSEFPTSFPQVSHKKRRLDINRTTISSF